MAMWGKNLRRKKSVGDVVQGDKVAYGLLKSFLSPILTLLFRPNVKGLRNVPAQGPVIIASNHLSFSDSIFMPLVVPRKVTFLAKSEDQRGC
jgi:1-acyl-sn-glycerol-3-phosphate acyltransferase